MGIANPGNGGNGLQGNRPPQQQRVIPFGKYLLLDRIAVGGMAEVYTAKSFGIEGFEKIIAIKRILPTMAEDDDFIEMFIDEAKIAGQLNHASIVPSTSSASSATRTTSRWSSSGARTCSRS
jgi:eukaryotic-like serine/threonine-protein kinase